MFLHVFLFNQNRSCMCQDQGKFSHLQNKVNVTEHVKLQCHARLF